MFAKYQTENWDWEDLRRLSMKKLNMWYWLFVLFMFQQQYGYLVIQMLMSHLDTHTNSDPSIKASIIEVLYESVLISAGGSIGREIYKSSVNTHSISMLFIRECNAFWYMMSLVCFLESLRVPIYWKIRFMPQCCLNKTLNSLFVCHRTLCPGCV